MAYVRRSRKELVFTALDDLAYNLFDRRDDDVLTREDLIESLHSGEVTMDDILTRFHLALCREMRSV